MTFNPETFRKHFPQLNLKVNNQDLVYLDNAASSLKHRQVIDRVNQYNSFEVANVHRGAHYVSNQGTENYEGAREQIRKFVNARSEREVVFTRGTTEGINLVAASYVGHFLQAGDEIVITPFEHHSNIVPWQQLCASHGLTLKVMAFDKSMGLSEAAITEAIGPKTRFVSALWYSNSFGNRLPIEKIIEQAHQVGAKVLIDAAQTPVHEIIDVQKLDCDFLVFSGHKLFAPYGIGVLYGKAQLLEAMPPYQTGGSMIDRVTFAKTTFAPVPQKFEAGTPNISGAIGLAEACKIVEEQGVASWHEHLLALRVKILAALAAVKGVEVFDFPAPAHSAVVSFNFAGAHPSDVGAILDQSAIAIRAGHHCTQPTMELLGIEGTVRVSLAPYNTLAEVEKFCQAVARLKEFF